MILASMRLGTVICWSLCMSALSPPVPLMAAFRTARELPG